MMTFYRIQIVVLARSSEIQPTLVVKQANPSGWEVQPA
jgi:hypothetical protein